MAKKNSSKTATEKALKASEPRLQVFTGWQGINFRDAPLGWEPCETGYSDFRQEDLKPNFFMVQNNLSTCSTLTVETRPDTIVIGQLPPMRSGATSIAFTGVSCMYNRWLFTVVHEVTGTNTFREYIIYRDITQNTTNSWTRITLFDAETNGEPSNYVITEIGYYEKAFIALTMHKSDNGEIDAGTHRIKYEGEIFTGIVDYYKYYTTTAGGIEVTGDAIKIYDEVVPSQSRLRSARHINEPTQAATISAKGELIGNATGDPVTDDDGNVHNLITRMDVCYTYVNKFGSTLPGPVSTYYFEWDPVTWSASMYASITGTLPANLPANHGITGVDVYCSLDNKQTKAFIGHASFSGTPAPGARWTLNWLGAMDDLSDWTNAQLELPEENDTKGVSATHFANHDSKLYFWGDPNCPYRLYIGGNAGSELSVARGLGGAFVDIEPGTGIEIQGTAKWKTVLGANIITMMCGNPNTNMVKRFNLIETNMTLTNEIASKGYMYEEVSNVQGCNSRWGYGVFADGLYSLNRYGLMLTTMAMEYNSQMRNTNMSEVIQPIFTERLGNRLKDARMVCIDEVIYIILSEDNAGNEPTNLDQVILCYDLGLKAWYTYTYDQNITARGEKLLHAMAIDSDEYIEGLGLFTDTEIRLYPTTGIQDQVAPGFNVLLETGELMARQPKQNTIYLCQLELRFDYFIGEAECLIEGTDYYGRQFKIYKKLNRNESSGTLRNWTEWIRVDKYVESYRVRIIGKARFRLVSMNAKVYAQSNRIGLAYGYDDHDYYKNRHVGTNDIHHYIKDYNNLRSAIVT